MVAQRLVGIPWVVSELKKELYAFDSELVREMVIVPQITHVPRMPDYVRGVINLRGSIIPLVDLRMYLGMESIVIENEALVEMLTKREQDHHNWLDRLEKTVAEGTVFDGELDPHKCAFGHWYDTYHTDNLLLEGLLRRFDKPHKAIHGIGDRVKTLQARGDTKGAMELVRSTRHGELAEMEHLFEQARELLRNDSREIAVVLANGMERLGVTVDSVESVETLNPESFTEPPMQALSQCGELICGTARRAKTDQMVMLFDTLHLLQDNAGAMTM